MRRTNAPRAIVIARHADEVQGRAILGAIGMIATLILVWACMVSLGLT